MTITPTYSSAPVHCQDQKVQPFCPLKAASGARKSLSVGAGYKQAHKHYAGCITTLFLG